MKKIIALMLSTVLAIGVIPQISAVAASNGLTVDCSNVIRSATHCASGSLYGVTESLPADIANLVAPLNPDVFNNPARAGSGYQQPVGAAIPVAGRLTGTTAKVSIRLADIFPGWPYEFTNSTDWLNKVTSVINDKLASGYSNFYGYEIWNEPNGTWLSANGDFDSNLWLPTYNLIREKDPAAQIIGPSTSGYSHSWMLSFLTFCKADNCIPDVICWHELAGPTYISTDINDLKAIENSLGISQRKIAINEYCDASQSLEGCPGSDAQFMGAFERYAVDSADISFWFTATPGRLGSLLASNTQPGGGWWFFNWYGQLNGNMVETTPSTSAGTGLDGCASVNSATKTITVLCGGTTDGTVDVTVNNIPSFIGSTASVKVECAPWTSRTTVVNNTTVISQSDYTVANGSITVDTSNANSTNGYRLLITPGSASGIQSGHTYKLENQNSARVLGILNASKSSGTDALQWSDSGTTDHNWTFTLLNDGYYKITNVNSGLVLGVAGSSTSAGALVDQENSTGATSQEWQAVLVSGRTFKLVNKNSGMCLGINNMYVADGASAIQWSDNGTVDHDWYLEFVS